MEYGAKRFDLTMQPVSGKALPVYRGEVLRIIQVEGGQCVDFNAFNLHDYKEYLGVSNTRSIGFRIGKGDIVWTQQSRNSPMYYILEMAPTCVTDLLGGRCNAQLRYREGVGLHTNCQDTFTEAVGEYGLTPDDVHDSFNMWMNTEWDSTGRWQITLNTGRAGDYVDLLALMDTLAVPIVCGSGDVRPTSNYSFKPIQVQVFEPSNDSQAVAEELWRKHSRFSRTLQDFRVQDIRTERELKPVPGYEPKFVNFPIVKRTIPVTLSAEEYAALQYLKERGLGDTDGEALRTAFFYWNTRTRSRIPLPFKGNLRSY
jgi:uncharacterized protein YcgI (DUF1989 family)